MDVRGNNIKKDPNSPHYIFNMVTKIKSFRNDFHSSFTFVHVICLPSKRVDVYLSFGVDILINW